MTTFHPLLEDHKPVQEAMFRLWTGLRCLFFKPDCQGMTADTKDTLDTSHAGTLVMGSEDLFLLFFGISTMRLENTALAAFLAPKLLATAGIVTILDDL